MNENGEEENERKNEENKEKKMIKKKKNKKEDIKKERIRKKIQKEKKKPGMAKKLMVSCSREWFLVGIFFYHFPEIALSSPAG